jgi:putative ABC transport system permease protein
MLKLALRNVFRHRARSAMTLGAIAVGVAGLILSGGFVQNIFTQLGELLIHSQSGHLQVSRAGFREEGARRPEQFRLADPDALARRIAAVPGVADAMARVSFAGLLNNGRTDLAIIGEGIDPAREERLGSGLTPVAGRRLTGSDRDAVMVGAGVARALRIAPGDHVTLLLNTDAGALNTLDLEVVGVFQTFSKDYDAHAIRVSLSAAQDALGASDVNRIVVALSRTRDTDAVAARLRSMLAGSGLEVRTWRELNDFYAKTVLLYDRQFGVLRFVILLMVLLSVASSVNMSLFERTAEFGTMRALGDRPARVARLIVTETALLGLIGAAIGVALGSILAIAISAVGIPMPPPPGSDLAYTARIDLVPSVVAGAFAVGVVAAALAGIVPALRLPKVPMVEALRHAV